MNATSIDSKQLIEEYFNALSGKPKTDELIDRFVSDPSLKEHIRQAEAGFPGYELIADQFVAEGDTVAMRGTMHGTHRGEFAGIPPTGKQVAADLMLFYRVTDGKITEHWMVFDSMSLVKQLTT